MSLRLSSLLRNTELETTLVLTDLTNEQTFEKVFHTYYSQLCAFAYQYLGDHDSAEETVQDVFSNVWTKAAQIEVRTTVKSYLYGATRNACLNFLKHEKIERRYEHQEMRRTDYHETDFLELDELQKEIDAALDKLPEKCRQIFMMSRYEEKKYQEIADELGISVKTVETQMGRALKVMRESLGKYLPMIVFLIYWQWMNDL